MNYGLQLIRAIHERRILRLNYMGSNREVEPYALCGTSGDQLILVVYQRSGHSKSGRPVGWKTLDLGHIISIEVLDQVFRPRADYNPRENQRYSRIIAEARHQEFDGSSG